MEELNAPKWTQIRVRKETRTKLKVLSNFHKRPMANMVEVLVEDYYNKTINRDK